MHILKFLFTNQSHKEMSSYFTQFYFKLNIFKSIVQNKIKHKIELNKIVKNVYCLFFCRSNEEMYDHQNLVIKLTIF